MADINLHLSRHLLVGNRLHHMADATIYGNIRGVDSHMLEMNYSFE